MLDFVQVREPQEKRERRLEAAAEVRRRRCNVKVREQLGDLLDSPRRPGRKEGRRADEDPQLDYGQDDERDPGAAAQGELVDADV